MASGTSDISQLPVASNENLDLNQPVQNNEQNIKIDNYGEKLNEQMNGETIVPISNSDINGALHDGLREASIAGATQLSSRDIPMETSRITQDNNIQANFIPNQNSNSNLNQNSNSNLNLNQNVDYIGNEFTNNQILRTNEIKNNNESFMENIFQEMQIPILIMILYFIFQLPKVNSFFIYLPSLFKKDGNPNIGGYIVNSLIFGLLYYLVTKLFNYLSSL